MHTAEHSRARLLTLVALIAASTFAISYPAAAQTTTGARTPGQWSVTPFAAVSFSGDLDQATKDFGADADYAWTPRVTFQGELNVLPTSESSGIFELGTHVWSLTGNLLYHFNSGTLMPYGVFGVGYAHAGADLSGVPTSQIGPVATSSNNFIVNFGGGVEHPLSSAVRLRGDLRYFFGGDLVPDFWRLGIGVNFDVGHP